MAISHGTYSGYQKHLKLGEVACGPCRQANTAYKREFRANRADQRARERRMVKARSRAAWRLVDLHRDEWQHLVLKELEDLP